VQFNPLLILSTHIFFFSPDGKGKLLHFYSQNPHQTST
jgi:hypothetical protein